MTTHGPALITVTGVTVPSAAKICVMPIFLPMIPLIIFGFPISNFQLPIASEFIAFQLPIGIWQSAMSSLSSERFDFHIDTRRQIELHQRVNRLWCWVEYVHQPLVRANLKLLARFLIDVRRAQHSPLILYRR